MERVWKKSEKLGNDNYTVIIHGKDQHEETRATFSHSNAYAKSVVIRDIEEARILGDLLMGLKPESEFYSIFKNRYSEGFDFKADFERIGVVNQTTMLASETQEISDYLATIMLKLYPKDAEEGHFANTRDTLCYATNDNQSATLRLLEEDADLAFVIGGYNSSNTSHLVELLERQFRTFYIKDETEIDATDQIHHFNMHNGEMETTANFLPNKRPLKLIITSGASCPDATVDRVIQKLAALTETELDIERALTELKETFKNEL